ncbi:hypothetical protein CSKR_113874 [Clonorchis sinensis]|uniref:Uncharacterized protein n=1 Tax=Clonorchis sinensis TaxID=79923 RepID=A0A419Q3U1_CLOSI|nr:hypothetical protein CSKR_113874 [Clonorchis sinensis]
MQHNVYELTQSVCAHDVRIKTRRDNQTCVAEIKFRKELLRDSSKIATHFLLSDWKISSLVTHSLGCKEKKRKNRSAVAPFRCLTAMLPEGCTRAGILPGCPSLDRGNREAEVGFEPRTCRSVSSRSNHLGHLGPCRKERNSVEAKAILIIIDSMTSVFNTDASLPYNHDLFESLIVNKRIKAIWIETDNNIVTDIGWQPYLAASPTRCPEDHTMSILES